jgi:hypothetical protein
VPRALPARLAPAPLSLDGLLGNIASAAAPRPVSVPKRRAALPQPAEPSPIPAAPAAARDRPIALVLWLRHQHCRCGRTHTTAADYTLVKYELNTHSFRYGRDISPTDDALPRERRETHVDVSFCEECF